MTTIAAAVKKEYAEKFSGYEYGSSVDASRNVQSAITQHVNITMQSESEIERVVFECLNFGCIEKQISNVEAFEDDEADDLTPTDINLLTLAAISAVIEESKEHQAQQLSDDLLEARIEHGLSFM